MKSKKIIVICAILAVVTVTAALLTACNTEEQIYSQIFDVCAKQNNLAITVKQGDITVYTYKDGAGHSDFEDLQITMRDIIGRFSRFGRAVRRI